MSYLESPRIAFSGKFQADVSTVNNDVRNYDLKSWVDRFQQMQEPAPGGGTIYNGWWNPDGTGSFRLLDVVVTSGETKKGPVAADPVLSLKVVSNPDCPPAKLVDLDPQFQMGSMLWGLQLVLTNGATEYLRGDFEPAPFRDLFFGRVKGVGGSKGASANSPAARQSALERAGAGLQAARRAEGERRRQWRLPLRQSGDLRLRHRGAESDLHAGQDDRRDRALAVGRAAVVHRRPPLRPGHRQPGQALLSQPDNIGFFDAVVGAARFSWTSAPRCRSPRWPATSPIWAS